MGGVIEWTALPVLVEVYGVEDVDLLIRALLAIRKHREARPRGA